MKPHKCPFCGAVLPDSSLVLTSHRFAFFSINDTTSPHLAVDIYRCPDKNCEKEMVIVHGENGYIENKTVLVYPESFAIHFPDYIPKGIIDDYKEAYSILTKSPKASATLSRRCLQGMIRDFWGIKKNKLIEEIKELQGKIPAAQWAAIDALRKLGNIGAHMEKDVNTIIEIDDHEAEMLLQLIELLIEKWYINRYDEENLYQKISEISLEKGKEANPHS